MVEEIGISHQSEKQNELEKCIIIEIACFVLFDFKNINNCIDVLHSVTRWLRLTYNQSVLKGK